MSAKAFVFISDWCGKPCKQLSKRLDKINQEFPQIDIIYIDVDESDELIQKYQIKDIPTVILVRDGEEFIRVIGSVLIKPLRKVFRELLEEEEMATNKKTAERKADVLWSLIEEAKLNIFALPNQTVKDHVERKDILDDQIHLKIRSPAVLPALEATLQEIDVAKSSKNEMWDITQVDNFVIVSSIPKEI